MGADIYKTGIVEASGENIGANLLTNTHEFITTSGGQGLTTDRWNGFIIRHLAPRTGTSYREVCAYNGFIPVVSGGSYTQSFWAKGTGYLTVHFYSGNIACATNKSSTGVNNTATDGNTAIYLTSEWVRYWVTHTLKTSSDTPANKNILLRLWDNDGANEVYVCGWKCEVGSIATSWCMNPNDAGYVGNHHGLIERSGVAIPASFYTNHIETNEFIEY